MSSSPPTSAIPDPAAIHRIEALEGWRHEGVSLAVLGHPIEHSLSPAMHNAALNAMAQTQQNFGAWRYFKFDVPPEHLAEALPKFAQAGFRGLNLTIPHKVEVLPLVDEIDPSARPMGALNTLHFTEGKWRGYNTDGFGLSRALQQDLQVSLRGAELVLLGAGGAARGAAVQILAEGCERLVLANRSRERLKTLLRDLRALEGGDRVEAFAPSEPPRDLPAAPIIVNATSLGLQPGDPAPVDLKLFGEGTRVYDMTYGCANALQRAAASRGFAYADGLSMLVWQGARALEIWSRTSVPAQFMMQAACHARGIPIRHV